MNVCVRSRYTRKRDSCETKIKNCAKNVLESCPRRATHISHDSFWSYDVWIVWETNNKVFCDRAPHADSSTISGYSSANFMGLISSSLSVHFSHFEQRIDVIINSTKNGTAVSGELCSCCKLWRRETNYRHFLEQKTSVTKFQHSCAFMKDSIFTILLGT